MTKTHPPAVPGATATLTIRRRTSKAGYTVRSYPARVVSSSRGLVVVEFINEASRIVRRACYPSQVRVHADQVPS